MSTNSLDLKNPFFRYTGQAPQAMPGTSTQSPTDAYWNSLVTGKLLPVQLVKLIAGFALHLGDRRLDSCVQHILSLVVSYFERMSTG